MEDRWLPDAITAAAAKHAPSFLEAVATIKTPIVTRGHTIVGIVASHYAASEPGDTINRVLQAIANAEPATGAAILGGLAKGWKTSAAIKLTDETEKALAMLLAKQSAQGRASVLRLASAMGSKGLEKHAAEVVKTLLENVSNDKSRDADRVTAAKQVIDLLPKQDNAVEQVLGALSPRSSPARRFWRSSNR
jgi:hypothetical protein